MIEVTLLRVVVSMIANDFPGVSLILQDYTCTIGFTIVIISARLFAKLSTKCRGMWLSVTPINILSWRPDYA
jgi:hypothetical protein